MSKTKKTDWWVTKWWKKDKKKEEKTSASSYWYDDYSSDFDYGSFYKGWGGVDATQVKSFQRTQDLYKLNSTRRAIANFVNIVTGRNIPVRYATRSMSHTDGDSVVLSADVNDNFDVSVGLALHEGSHIVLSQFDLLAAINHTKCVANDYMMYNNNPTKDGYENALNSALGHPIAKKYSEVLNRIFGLKGLYRHTFPSVNIENVVELVHSITNWIEDRRIDAYIYKNAPGYRQYYLKLYDHYFNSKDVTKGIESDEYTDETIESYIFRIINFTNEKTDLNKLKGLRKIHGMIDLRNINRLKTTTDCMNLAIDAIEEIYKNCGQPMFDKSSQQGQGQGSGDGDSDTIQITDINDGESDEQGGSAGQIGNGMTGQLSTNPSSQGKDADGDSKPVKIELSKTAMDKLKKAIQKQKDFLNDKIKKKNISKDEEKSLKNIEESDSQMVNVGGSVQSTVDYHGSTGQTQTKGVDCVVVKRVTPAMLEGDSTFPFSNGREAYMDEVQEGIKLGTMLGNKLSVRSETRDTVFNRLNKGKIDQRLISGLGYGAESVFYTREVDQYKKANLHISVDYSGSMQGSRIRNAIVCTTAIVKAATMARNINVQVSVRSTSNCGNHSLPYIALVYDSRRDTFKWFCEVMSKMVTTNTTPEGLCFEAIMKHFVPTNKDVDSYFLNLSDGEPCFQMNGYQYSGEPAAQHTARQVKQMRENGMNILSYFINDGGMDSRSWQVFRKCYGADARLVNPRNMLDIAKTMNEMFLKKGKRTE